jgi:hypothetical protein
MKTYYMLQLRILLTIVPIMETLRHPGWHTWHISLASVKHHGIGDVAGVY